MQITPRMREHVEEKLKKLARFRHLIEARVVLKIEKYLYVSEITLIGKKLRFYGEGRSQGNFFAAFDEAENKVVIQLQRKKEKLKDRYKIRSERNVEELMADGEARGRKRLGPER